MPAQPKHRQAIVQAAVVQFRRRGYAATGLNEIVERSGAPKGSLYHYFPRGKAQIGEAAVRAAGEVVRRTLEQIRAETPDAAGLIGEYVRRLAGWMAQSGWRDGCPITTTLLETAADEPMIREAGREALEAWTAVLADALMAERVGFDRASRLAAFAISALEGALVQARTMRSDTPILAAGEELAALFRAAKRP